MFVEDILNDNHYYISNPITLLNNEWVWDQIKFQNLPDNKLIIVNYSSENWGEGNIILSCYNQLEMYQKKFLILTHQPDQHLITPNILFYPYWYNYTLSKQHFFKLDINTPKRYHLSCLNGVPRPHRILNYILLKKYNYDKSLISMHNDYNLKLRDDDYQLSTEVLEEWERIRTEFSTHAELLNSGISNRSNRIPAYSDSYINLVTESTISSKLFITEKTWKSVASGQIFLILGNPHSIKYLRNQGVDTFDDIVDHDYYDAEPDFETRIKKIHQMLSQLLRSDLSSIYNSLLDRRQKNVDNWFAGKFNNNYAQLLKEKICINTQN